MLDGIRWDLARWAVGLKPFVALGALHLSQVVRCVAWIVVLNGVLCHGSYAMGHRHAPLFRWWDIAVNFCMANYINFTAPHQLWTWSWTAVAVVCFSLNQRVGSPVLHWLGVAMPLAMSLYYYE